MYFCGRQSNKISENFFGFMSQVCYAKTYVTKGDISFRKGMRLHLIFSIIYSSTDMPGSALKAFGMLLFMLGGNPVFTKYTESYKCTLSSVSTSKCSGTKPKLVQLH